MKRLPAVLSLILFLALCASLAYWLLQWLAPAPRPVAAPPVAQRPPAPLTAAFNLFGGNPQSGAPGLELRGIIRSGRAADSVAIITVEGKPPRALRTHAEVMPGVEISEIRAKTVILSDKGASRELALPPFATQPGAAQDMTAMNTAPAQAVQLQQQATQPAVPPPVQAPAPAAMQPVPGTAPPPAQGGVVTGGSNIGTGAAGVGAVGTGTPGAGTAATPAGAAPPAAGPSGGTGAASADASGPSGRTPPGLRARNATDLR